MGMDKVSKDSNYAKLCLKKIGQNKLLSLTALLVFVIVIITVVLLVIFYSHQKDYINEFTVRDKKGFGELKGCIGKIRFEPGFQRGNVFEKTTSGSKHRKWEIKAKSVETKRVIIEESCCWKLYDNDGTEKLLKRGSHNLEMFYIKEFSSDNC